MSKGWVSEIGLPAEVGSASPHLGIAFLAADSDAFSNTVFLAGVRFLSHCLSFGFGISILGEAI